MWKRNAAPETRMFTSDRMMNSTTLTSCTRKIDDPVTRNQLHNLRVHMVGIGGSGMAGLAAMLLKRGARVTGTDRVASVATARLAESGAHISTQQNAQAVPADAEVVVASAAIPPDHAELAVAAERGIRVLKYAELLGLLMSHSDGIAISGTHGKSTTSAWLTFVLRQAGSDPSFVIGADVPQLGGGSGVGDGPHFVAEACEYDRSFLSLAPRRAAVLNIEEDHLDYYRDLADIQSAFTRFAQRVPADGLVVLNADNDACAALSAQLACEVATFGRAEDADYRPLDVEFHQGHAEFEVAHHGTTLGRLRLGLPGQQNIDNALAVIALARDCSVPWPVIASGLAEFTGVHRRLELHGTPRDITVLDDYAHHPTEIRVTLDAARQRFHPARLWCVFQPHQHSRTRFLLDDFAACFAGADHVVVPDIYFVRDTERDRQAVCAADLVREVRARGSDAAYVPTFDEIVTLLERELRPHDVVITMGAGPIWKVAHALVQRLGGNLPT